MWTSTWWLPFLRRLGSIRKLSNIAHRRLMYNDGRIQGGYQMKRFALFAAGLGVLVAGIVLLPGTAQGQAGKSSGFRLSLVGIAVSDYSKSQAFYERVMGFPVAFKLSSP